MPNASFDQVCDSVDLSANIIGKGAIYFGQNLEPVSLDSTMDRGLVAKLQHFTGAATLSSTVTLGERPVRPVRKAGVYNLTGEVRNGGGALLCFVGPPFKTIEWRMVEGIGSLTPYSDATNEFGQAIARFDAQTGFRTVVVVGVAWVP